jgi:polyhydroxybutyrate depolymerase
MRIASALATALVAITLSGCATTEVESERLTAARAGAPAVKTVLTVGETTRTVAIARGDTHGDALVPAIILLHGATGSGARMEAGTGMTALAREHGFVVAYPDGTTTGRPVGGLAWNAGGCCAAPVSRAVDDVSFLSAVIDELVANHGVDPDRVYLGGFSNGGMMSYRFACEMGESIAGIVVVGGAFNVSTCDPPGPLPVVIIHGTADATVPYSGGRPNAVTAKKLGSWVNASVSDAIDYWSGVNECSDTETVVDDGSVRIDEATGCVPGSSLDVVSVIDGGHSWPTVPVIGFDASTFVVEYFQLDQ